MTKSRNILKPRVTYSAEQIDAITQRYPHEATATLAADIGLTVDQIYRKVASLGLKKSPEYLASPDACRLRRGDQVGKAHRFATGHVPFNKGVKGINYPGMQATQFKPGERRGVAVKLYQPIGTERISKDGYIQRKINDDMPLQKRWRGVHSLVWEAANGPLPNGHAVVFKDRNKQNVALDNLELVTRGELMRRNSYHTNLPKEVAQLVQLRGVISRKINQRIKNEQ